MMRSKYHISDTEYEVLKMLWKQKESVRQSQLLELFQKEGKEWKRQTLNTFLSRLEEKGLVKREKGMVCASLGEEEFKFCQMQNALERLYDGRISSFVAAFQKKQALSKEEVEELRKLID